MVNVLEMCNTAAKWWGNKIRGFGSRHDNGDREETGGLAGLLADLMNEPITDEITIKFEKILEQKLIEEQKAGRKFLWFGCDYSPDKILADSAKEAGVPLSNFPWKTRMHVEFEDECVLVADGYRAQWETIYGRRS